MFVKQVGVFGIAMIAGPGAMGCGEEGSLTTPALRDAAASPRMRASWPRRV